MSERDDGQRNRFSTSDHAAPGPDGSLAGDHYDMTRFRIIFEHLHRSLGYLALFLSMITILTGLWAANVPRWMWIVLLSYWMFLMIAAVWMQCIGRAYDTYQAIWGPASNLPGNRMKKMGWWTVRPSDKYDKSSQGGE